MSGPRPSGQRAGSSRVRRALPRAGALAAAAWVALAVVVAVVAAAPARAQSAGAAGGAQGSAPATFRDCDRCPEMVRIPAGTFTFGTPTADAADPATRAESQALLVRIARPFAIGRTEVTRGQFAAFVADTDHEFQANCRTWNDELRRYADDRTRTWRNPGRPREARDDHPVSCVSWSDANAYVQWLARKTGKRYRLPSETEWEYAARARSATSRPWGESAADGCAYANAYDAAGRAQFPFGWASAACDDRWPDVAPVASLQPNAFGVHDAIGNLWEWVEDCATDSYVGRPADGRAWVWTGGCARRVQRGGSWLTPPERARSAFRGEGAVDDRADYLGFRVALDLAEGR